MCGVCGVYILQDRSLPNIAKALNTVGLEGDKLVKKGSAAAGVTFFLLKYLNNRGHDSSGIVVSDGGEYHLYRGMGFAQDVFNQGILERLVGNVGIGHDRYATTGLPKPQNIQPFVLELEDIVSIALAHNGNIVNEKELRGAIIIEERRLWVEPRITSTTDSELMLHSLGLEFFKDQQVQLEKLVKRGLSKFRGAYSTTIMIGENLVGVRDPCGFWPLYIARLGNLVLFSSEESPIRKFIAASGYMLQPSDFVRSVRRGEIEIVNTQMSRTYTGCFPYRRERECSFDDSYVRSHEDPAIMQFRKNCGSLLWQKFPVSVNYVVPVPRSGISFARGLSKASGIPLEQLIGLNPIYKTIEYRSFQESTEGDRLKAAKSKYVFRDSYENLIIILTDDSIVRNTTMRYLITELRKRRVAGIHLRIGTPPIVTPCYLGIHTPTKDELIASSLTEKQVEDYFRGIFYGVDYVKDELVSLIREGMPVEAIVAKSVHDKKNFLENPEMRRVKEREFSLRHLLTGDYRRAFDLSGLGSNTKCYACQIRGGAGYPKEIERHLLTMGVI